MRKIRLSVMCFLMGSSVLFSSCIGSFGIWNQLKSWNQNIGNKFVNEIVFFAFHVVPVYEVAYLADILVLNSIEFWSGSNPMANIGTSKVINSENGVYTVTTNQDGYTITKAGEENTPLELVYNYENNTWNAVSEGESYELIAMNEDGTVTVKQADGTDVTVTADQNGVNSIKAMN